MTFQNLNEMLAETVREIPGATAFIYKGRTITYREFEVSVTRCSEALAQLGIRRGDTFGIVLRNCPEFVILFFALGRLGAVAVPVNFLEKAERLAYVFNDAQVKGCLTSAEFVGVVQEARKTVPTLKHLFLKESTAPDSFQSLLLDRTGRPSAISAETNIQPDDLAYLIYTAGTTGSPKGVMLTHKNFCANVESCRGAIELRREDRFMCLLPMFHSFAWTTNVLLPIRLGSSTVIIESLLPFEPVIKAIWEHKVSLFCGMPPLFAALVQKVKGVKALVLRLLNPVRVAISGAAALPPEVLKSFEATFGIPLLEGYGLTEAAPVVSLNPLHGKRKLGSVGLPIPNVKIKIIDEHESVLGPETVGEVCVMGDNVMPGYYRRPEESRECFTQDGWLRTGDLGKLDTEGYLTIVDRKKDLIIVKGLNVYPQEIETVLLTHPAISEAAAVGIRDASGDEIIRAFVTLKQGHTVEREELLQLCRQKLAMYKWPRDINILETMPKNAMGKILKTRLREEGLAK